MEKLQKTESARERKIKRISVILTEDAKQKMGECVCACACVYVCMCACVYVCCEGMSKHSVRG